MSTLFKAFSHNFMGNTHKWYKAAIFSFLVINPIILIISPVVAGWLVVLEVIFTLHGLKMLPTDSWWFTGY